MSDKRTSQHEWQRDFDAKRATEKAAEAAKAAEATKKPTSPLPPPPSTGGGVSTLLIGALALVAMAIVIGVLYLTGVGTL